MKLSKEENRALAFIAVMIALSVLGRWADRPLPLTTDLAAINIDSLADASEAAAARPKSKVGKKPPKPAAAVQVGTDPAAMSPVAKAAIAKAPPEPVDVNRATAAELEKVRGIGPVLAARIIAYRDSVGRFANVDALTGVKGVGPAMLERLRPYLRVP